MSQTHKGVVRGVSAEEERDKGGRGQMANLFRVDPDHMRVRRSSPADAMDDNHTPV